MSTNSNIERELLTKPGDTIIETLEHLKMSQAELAERLGKTPSKVNDLISGKAPITVNTALQLEKVLGIEMQFWLNREMNYREKLARIEQEEFLEECKGWLKQQPIKELHKFGYLKSDKPSNDLVEECLQFYGVASPLQWQNVYVDSYTQTSFRKSPAYTSLLASMAAWLRIGELKLRKLQLPEFNKESFKKALESIRELVQFHPEDYAIQLKNLCNESGVAVIYSHSLPKAPISGAARWVSGIPVIQITDRYKTNDQFWFTFFHEAGHIILHGKKEVFIEGEDFGNNVEKEEQANDFASEYLLPKSFVEDIVEKVDERAIKKIARAYATHPAIVLARLQKLEIVPYYFATELKEKVDLENFIDL